MLIKQQFNKLQMVFKRKQNRSIFWGGSVSFQLPSCMSKFLPFPFKTKYKSYFFFFSPLSQIPYLFSPAVSKVKQKPVSGFQEEKKKHLLEVPNHIHFEVPQNRQWVLYHVAVKGAKSSHSSSAVLLQS